MPKKKTTTCYIEEAEIKNTLCDVKKIISVKWVNKRLVIRGEQYG